jgi:hypothetical protein
MRESRKITVEVVLPLEGDVARLALIRLCASLILRRAVSHETGDWPCQLPR